VKVRRVGIKRRRFGNRLEEGIDRLVIRVLYLIPRLEPCGAAKQLTLLAGGLPRDKFEPCVCVLGRDGPFRAPLDKAGVRVAMLGWYRAFDAAPIWRLARLLQDFHPEIIHAW
jgi:hypothetical protein